MNSGSSEDDDPDNVLGSLNNIATKSRPSLSSACLIIHFALFLTCFKAANLTFGSLVAS